MSDDVLITPASRKIEFKDSGGTVDAKIETDSSGNLTITNPGGDISLGDTTADVIIGDGVNSVDLIMEVNGEIRGTSGVTITLGDSGSNISMGTDLGLNSNDITGTGNVNITGGITVTGNVTASAFYGDGSNLTGITATGASAATSATLQTKINALSATMATSINNRTAAITSVNTRINSVSSLAASVSSTMATSINNRTAAITSVNTRIGTVSAITSVNTAAITSVNNVMMRKSATTNLDMNNFNITEVNALTFNDPGPQEGINFNGGNLWKIYESPDDLTTNSSGNLQFAKNTTRSMTLNTNGNLFVSGNVTATSFYGDGSNLTGITATGASVGTSATLQTKINALSATMATSINNRTAAITSVNTRIGNVSAITSSNVDAISSVNTRIGTVSAITSSNAVAIANLSAGEILTRIKTVDGSGSGLDADLFDGLNSSVFLRSSQSDTMSGNLTVTGNVTASAFYGDGSNLTGITASNADTVDNLHASSFLRSDADDSTTGGLTVISGSIDATNTTKGLLFDGNYTNGQYRTRFRKQDKSGGLPLYIDATGGTANSYTELARFGAYTGNSYELEVFGDINATGNLYDGGNAVWHAGNDGAGSGLDADTLDGVQGSSYLRSDATDTTTGYFSVDNHFRVVNPSAVSGQGDNHTHFNYQDNGINYIRGTNTYFSSPAEFANSVTIDRQSPVLQLEADANYSSYIRFSQGSTLQDGEIQYAPAVDTMYFRTGNTSSRMSIDGSGNVVAAGNVTAYSDERLKDNIETLDGSKVYDMRGVSFTKDGEAGSGVIAQELQKVAPELVHEKDEYLTVAYGNLTGYLIETVKELNERIKTLEAKLEKD